MQISIIYEHFKYFIIRKAMRCLALITLISALQVPAAADARVVPVSASNCVMKENATLSVSFNGVSEAATGVQAKLLMELGAIEGYAKEMGIHKLDLQNQSYNIYTQDNGGRINGYNFNTSASYRVDDANKAVKLMELLTSKGVQASVNVNSYRNGNCD